MDGQVIPVRELNQHTSAVLRRVRAGEELLISVSGTPVARLAPLAHGDGDFLRDLARRGMAVLATDVTPFPRPPVLGDPEPAVAELYARQREEELF